LQKLLEDFRIVREDYFYPKKTEGKFYWERINRESIVFLISSQLIVYELSDIGFMCGVDELFMYFIVGMKLSSSRWSSCNCSFFA
jgi:hypothetical protein